MKKLIPVSVFSLFVLMVFMVSMMHNFKAIGLSSGVYFYKLITNDFVQTKKMLLAK